MSAIRNYIKQFVIRLLPLYQYLLVRILRHKKQINVVFYAFSLSMWRYQHLYEAMSKHHRFKTTIVIIPTLSYSEEQQAKDIDILVHFFTSKNIPFLLIEDENGHILNIKKELKPDLIFYPQPYYGLFKKEHLYNEYLSRLLCYYPYAFWRSSDNWSYNLPFHNIAWKLFYSTELHRKDAQMIASNKGYNVEVVGYPTADDFLFRDHVDLWKPQSTRKKRVIWAPHFTIQTGGFLYQSNFLWMADLMVDIAKKYSDKIQFAFKPHPRLYTELCRDVVWGQKKTDAYYKQWAIMENSQLETGEFVDLFMTSDAMVHDSGSFSVEYLYTNNPVMFVAKDFEEQVEKCSEFGQMAMRQQYVGTNKDDIINFIEKVVLGGEDSMATQRRDFVEAYLVPPNGKTVVENTMDVLLKELC